MRKLTELKYQISKRAERLEIRLAQNLPKRLKMRVYFDILAHSTTGKYGKTIVPDLTAMDAIDRYCKDNNL